VLLTALISAAFYFLPVLKEISSGISISICAVAAAVFGAVVFPREEGEQD
jgi:hypothetical protein